MLGHSAVVGLFLLALALAARGDPGDPGAQAQQARVSAGRVTAAHQEAADRQAAPVPPDSAAVDRGRVTYGFYCMSCHGGDGRGGVDGGSDLMESEMLRASDGDRQFAEFLPVGRPEQRMPQTPLPENEIADLWAFLQVLISSHAAADAAAGSAPIVGDANAGEASFGRAGCGRCHSATGDLKGIGARLDAATIHRRLVRPEPGGRAAGAAASAVDAESLRGHTEIVKKLSEQDVRDLAVYLATLR